MTHRKVSIAAASFLLLGSLFAPAYGAGEPPAESAPPPPVEPGGGGCCCCGTVAAAGEAGAWCRGGGQGGGGGYGMRHRRGGGEPGMGPRMGRGMGPGPGGPAGNRELMVAVRALVHDYRDDIVREVEEIENGVVTITRSPENPEAAAVLQRHVSEMQALLESGGRIRGWDPLFSEIFDHSSQIQLTVETLDDGVRVTETSDDREVVKLIRAHARKVDEFVARGPEAVHEPTALPEGYRTAEGERTAGGRFDGRRFRGSGSDRPCRASARQ